MSKAEEAADDLIEQYKRSHVILIKNTKGKLYSPYKSVFAYNTVQESQAVRFALMDNQNTIDALEAIPDLKVVGNILLDIIEHYQAVQTILKSKLK